VATVSQVYMDNSATLAAHFTRALILRNEIAHASYDGIHVGLGIGRNVGGD